MLRYKTKTRPGLVALYDIRPGNGAGPFLQPRSPHGAAKGQDHQAALVSCSSHHIIYLDVNSLYATAQSPLARGGDILWRPPAQLVQLAVLVGMSITVNSLLQAETPPIRAELGFSTAHICKHKPLSNYEGRCDKVFDNMLAEATICAH